MGWIKTRLPEKWHGKVKAYRDESNSQNMTQAACALIQRGIVAYEDEHGSLNDEPQ
jgi:hypothetical protein